MKENKKNIVLKTISVNNFEKKNNEGKRTIVTRTRRQLQINNL